jgi:hypothetical protein
MATCDESNLKQQFWYDQWRMRLSVGGNKCLDASQRNTDSGKVHLWDCDANNDNQKFIFDSIDLPPTDCVGAFPTWQDDDSQCTVVGHRRLKIRYFEITTAQAFGGTHCDNADGDVDEGVECTEPIDVEMSVNPATIPLNSDGGYDFSALVQTIAAQLGVDPSAVSIQAGTQPNPISRRLTEIERLLITVTVNVLPSEVSEEIEKLESPSFATATGATFMELKPAHGSVICATCKWEAGKIEVTHYINAQGHGEQGLQHKCYHVGNKCKCQCRGPKSRPTADTWEQYSNQEWTTDLGIGHTETSRNGRLTT